MKAEKLLDAMKYLDDEIVLEVSTMNTRKNITSRRPMRTLLIAAVIACLLATTAFATGFFGFRALLKEEKVNYMQEEYSQISLTQPQEVPEEMDAAIAEKVENSRKAWAEWESWLEANPPESVYDYLSEVFG